MGVFEPLTEEEAGAVNRLRVGALVWVELRKAGKPVLQPGEVAPLFGLPVEVRPDMRLDAYELVGHHGELIRSGTLYEVAEPEKPWPPLGVICPPAKPEYRPGLDAVRRIANEWSLPRIPLTGV